MSLEQTAKEQINAEVWKLNQRQEEMRFKIQQMSYARKQELITIHNNILNMFNVIKEFNNWIKEQEQEREPINLFYPINTKLTESKQLNSDLAAYFVAVFNALEDANNYLNKIQNACEKPQKKPNIYVNNQK